VPPVTVTSIEPSFPTDSGITKALITIALGSVIVDEPLSVQPFASVNVPE